MIRENENSHETKFCEILRKVSEYSLIFASRENEERGFRFNPTVKLIVRLPTQVIANSVERV
jgi:hypothetical protein